MINLEIYNSFCKIISDITAEDESKIRQSTAYESSEAIQAAYLQKVKYGRNISSVKYLFDKRSNTFPTGILPIVERSVKGRINFIDKRVIPKRTPFLEVNAVPRSYQLEAVEALLRKTRGVAIMATGTGKTIVSAMISSRFMESRVLITTPSKALLKQTRKSVSKVLGEEVGIIGETKLDLSRRVTVATVQSLASALNKEKKDVLDFLKLIQVWVLDECHGAAAATYTTLSDYLENASIRYGLTATWMREDGCELIMEGVVGPIAYEYSYESAFREGYLTKPKVIFREMTYSESKKSSYKEEYKTKISENNKRNIKLCLDVATLVDQGYTPCLVFVHLKDHGKELASILNCEYIDGEDNSKKVEQVLKDFELGNIPLLVASSIINVGVDFIRVKSGVNAAAGESRIAALQKIGRGLRLSSDKDKFIYVDYVDKDKGVFNKHSLTRRSLYKMYFPGKVIDITTDADLLEKINSVQKVYEVVDNE